jgi:RNA recognition motif-containing protein
VKNIFVGNLPFQTSDHDLLNLFSAYGTVDRAQVVMDRDTGKSRGFGFVEMPVDAEADQAISALNGQMLNGRAINVNEARPKSSGGGGGRGGYGGGRREPRW